MGLANWKPNFFQFITFSGNRLTYCSFVLLHLVAPKGAVFCIYRDSWPFPFYGAEMSVFTVSAICSGIAISGDGGCSKTKCYIFDQHCLG